MYESLKSIALACLLVSGMPACGDNTGVDPLPDAGQPDAADPGPDAAPVEGCLAGEVPCRDDVVLDLSLHDDRTSDGDVVTVQDGDSFVSTIDATAGGFGQSNDNAYLYMRFESGGMVKVDIDDETAFESTNWHIAARRFIVRLNGGNSGPGCVGAFEMVGETFESVTAIPDGVDPVYDDFYDGSCNIVEDGSGLPGSPLVALKGWWDYVSCVETTGTPFVVQLDGETAIKAVFESYYETGQEQCNNGGTPGSGGANLRVRWSFL